MIGPPNLGIPTEIVEESGFQAEVVGSHAAVNDHGAALKCAAANLDRHPLGNGFIETQPYARVGDFLHNDRTFASPLGVDRERHQM